MSTDPSGAESVPETPSEFFVFVNQASFWTRHNFGLTGRFVSSGFAAAVPDQVPVGTVMAYSPGPSAPSGDDIRTAYVNGTLDYLMFAPSPTYFGWPTPFASNVVTDYRIEYDAEVCRRWRFPLLPSRLSATYAFGDFDTCVAVSEKHRWPLDEVERFRLIPHELNRVHRVNMEIVSLARCAYRRAMFSATDLDAIWRTYWTGGGNMPLELPVDGRVHERVDSGVIWEFLIEGVLERIQPGPDAATSG